jgi:uncharacterized membrane-anchored protein YhcB (DUF1043 family)
MSNRFNEIYQLVKELEADFQKFYEKENQAAGTRIRKGMQDLKNIAQSIRLEVQNKKNERAAASKKEAAPAKDAKPAKPAAAKVEAKPEAKKPAPKKKK